MKLTDLQAAIAKSDNKFANTDMNVSKEVIAQVHSYANKVQNWLEGKGMVRGGMSNNISHAMENFSLKDTTPDSLISEMEALFASMNINTDRSTEKVFKEIVGGAMINTLGKSAATAWSDWSRQGVPQTLSSTNRHMGIESYIPNQILRDFTTFDVIGQEAFGVDTDKALPDLRTSIVVGIMKFMTSITGKMFSKKTLSEPMMYINTDVVNVYKTDSTAPEIPLVELNRDPEIVSVELTRVVAREANDTVGDVLAEDSYVRINKEANMMALSLDASKPAFASANKTDLLSDDVRLESVVVSFANAGGTTEAFEFKVPSALSRLTYATQGMSTKRVANITFDAYIKNNTNTRAAAPTALFAALHADDVAVVTITVNPVIDLKTTKYMCTGAIQVAVQNATSATTAANVASTTALGLVTVRNLLTTKPDARFSEENLRKTNIGAEVVTQTYSYNIPQGRNYFVDYAFTQNMDTDRSTATLLALINHGLDYRTLKLIEAEIGSTKDKWATYVPSGTTVFQPGTGYACSNRIKPFAYTDTFDCSQYESMKELEKMADIHTAARIFFNGVCTEIDGKSYISAQLNGGQCNYRVVTNPEFLGNILGIAHMHDRLKASAPAEPAPGTVNVIIMLDSGITLEVVSTTYDSMKNKVLGIPYIDVDPNCTMNFAINGDMGSLVAHYQSDFANGGGLRNRLFTNVRELPVVTNPSGFAVSVSGMPAELHM